MKKLKRIFSLMIAVVMVLAMNVTAFAEDDETYSITISNSNTGHTYEAYQVFQGDLSGNVLSNVEWGTGVKGDTLLTALKADDTLKSIFGDCNTAAKVAEKLAELNNDSSEMDAFAAVVSKNLGTAAGFANQPSSGGYTISKLSAGYYFVKDAATVTGSDASTKFILRLTKYDVDNNNNVTVTPKSDIPTVEKKVNEDDKYNQDGGYGKGYNDVADWNIGDDVPFKLIGTLPSNYNDYDSYSYVFHDTLSSGLTYNNSTVAVYLENKVDSEVVRTPITNYFNVVYEENNLTISCLVTTDEDGSVTDSGLKKIAGITSSSKIVVEYTAKLNASAVIGLDGNTNKVYLEFSNNPNVGGEGETGKTPIDKVIVFTYELDVKKVDGEDKTTTLKDAEFKLHNASNKWVIVDTEGKVTGWADTEDGGSTLKSDENGLFNVIGLDDGTYYLKETKAPDGYNLLNSEIKLDITATTANGQTWSGTASDALTALKISVNNGDEIEGTLSTGIVGATVENNQGATLPSTGGMGTRIFYAVGAVLMIGAAVILITRKRSAK